MFKVKAISKKYTDNVGYNINLFNDISFELDTKEFITFLAPKGSGKSSLLKILSGLDKPTSGTIKSDCKKTVFIPSQPSSFPWLNVEENIRFNSNISNKEITNLIRMVGLEGYENHFPHNKSEGFRFRMSLGRALANKPDLLIIDEPFNNLNNETRKDTYQLIRDIFQNNNFPIIFGTTNITEALFLSDKVFVMKKSPGKIIDKIEIDFEEPRKMKDMDLSTFISFRDKIEKSFLQKSTGNIYNFSI